MPSCLLDAYALQLDRLRAERVLDASQAAVYPHLTKDGARDWIAAWTGRARRERDAASAPLAFTVNGRPVTVGGLKRSLTAAMGSGLERD